jgi:uncharacterized protein YbbC (DUF1343 family)
MHPVKYLFVFFLALASVSGFSQNLFKSKTKSTKVKEILPGAYQTIEFLPLLKEKKVAVVANKTSLINNTHLVDTLVSLGIDVVKIFGPEHGFRGDQPDGKEIDNDIDTKTGIEIVSLYGNHRKPTKTDLENVDIVVFDIQDVGVRFYTYISTLTLVMDACAESNIPLIITDRPNPNGYYVDGPVLDTTFSSFVGMHPVPIVYGMTIGEYATMVNGEKWLSGGETCAITVVRCKNYTHDSRYKLLVAPSPNLQDMNAVYLYPSLCLFEGTVVSIGRGTDNPFKVFGHPLLLKSSFSFTPTPISGVSEDPPLNGQLCNGQDLSEHSEKISKYGKLELSWLIETYNIICPQTDFFKPYFDKLAGGTLLREQIETGVEEKEIHLSWRTGLKDFKKIREKYLLYPDFE